MPQSTECLLEFYRNKAEIKRARKTQLNVIIDALGGRDNGWRGFSLAEEVVSYLRENEADYSDLVDVADLVDRLGVAEKLSDFSKETIEAARESECDDLQRLDEVIAQTRGEREVW